MKVFSPGLAVTTALTYALLFAAAPHAFGQTGFFGAYDPRLQEVLWNDAVGLQQNGNHQEAIEKLKRAAHLSRVNDGLDAKSQLPFVRACGPTPQSPHHLPTRSVEIDLRQSNLGPLRPLWSDGTPKIRFRRRQ